MNYKPQMPDESINVTTTHFVSEGFKLLVGLIVTVALAYGFLVLVIHIAIENLSIENEKKIHKLLSTKFVSQHSVNEHEKYLQGIVDHLNRCAKLPYNLDIRISSSSTPNAMAVVGGSIIVTQGMLDTLKNENELTFVLGHEMAHFKHRDHLKGLSSSIALMLFWMVLGDDSSNILNQLLEMEQMHYSKKQESHADRFGVDMLVCRYGSSVGASDLFGRMVKEDQWSDFMLTHPNFAKRVKKIETYIKQKGYKSNGELKPLLYQK
ncbi:MAG: M48 family metallopeptidase [Campylobacterales bacterium]|nr:M48 family metallopeptidase [Campylobacterales bacterium]